LAHTQIRTRAGPKTVSKSGTATQDTCSAECPNSRRVLHGVATMPGSVPPPPCRVPCLLLTRQGHRATPKCFVLPTARPPPLSPALERSSMATAAMDGHRGQSRLVPMTSRVAAKPSNHRPGNSPYALYTLDRGRCRCHFLMAAAAMTGRRQRACRGCR
jgi:hypothetical protein